MVEVVKFSLVTFLELVSLSAINVGIKMGCMLMETIRKRKATSTEAIETQEQTLQDLVQQRSLNRHRDTAGWREPRTKIKDKTAEIDKDIAKL